MIVSIFSINAIATEPKATTYYAYSIGVNHGTTNSGLTGNFVPNILYANTCYGMINGITSFYNNAPDISYMKGNNPAGIRRIASRVVWLNGHANNTTLVFNHNNNGGSYDTGVYYGTDTSKYVGLQSTSMSGVDLISFVGCETAKGTTNLASRARSQGAITAVGFTGKIVSRSSDGQGWCRKYNDALALGHTISSAISYATSFYPNSNLPTYVKVYGSTSNRIASSGNVASLSTTNYTEETKVINVDTLYNNVGHIYNGELKNYNAEMANIIDRIHTYDSTFNANDYTISVNMYSDDGESGIVILQYKIGDILTNKAYVATIENGVVTDIICNEIAVESKAKNTNKIYNTTISEKALLKLVEEHKAKQSSLTLQTNDSNVDVESKYIYDYSTNKLIYQKCIYTSIPSADNVIVDTVIEEVLN